MRPSYNDVITYSLQGVVDGWEWLQFLRTHGKADYQVLLFADPFSPCDAIMESPERKRTYIELKTRNCTISQYQDCYIDERKINDLQRIAQATGDKVYLVALYPASSKIALWEIRGDQEYEVIEKVANVTTIQDSRPQYRCPKRLVPLPLREARKYNHRFYQQQQQWN